MAAKTAVLVISEDTAGSGAVPNPKMGMLPPLLPNWILGMGIEIAGIRGKSRYDNSGVVEL